MGIQEDIFESFLNRLSEDTEFPDSVVESLRGLLENGEVITQETIFDLIERDSEGVDEDQEN